MTSFIKAFRGIKYKRTNASIFTIAVLAFYFVSYPAIDAFIDGNVVPGVIVETQRTINHNNNSIRTGKTSGSSSQSIRHDVTTEYVVDDIVYLKKTNIHVLSYLDTFDKGKTVNVFYDESRPNVSGVLTYGAFSPLTLILGYLIIMLILGFAFQFIRQLIFVKP